MPIVHSRVAVADICSKEERGANMARLGGLMMFGYAGGPPLGAAIGAAASLVRTLHRDPRSP